MKAQVDALLKALGESGCEGARARMSDLVGAIQAPIDGALTRAVLDTLRSRRCFLAMQVFAAEAAKVAQGNLLVYVKRQLAQAKIELGRLDEAVNLLRGLAPEIDAGGSAKERSEVSGLLGRAHKQRFVEAVAGGARGDDELRAAVRAYHRVYDLDKAWHGANIVALVARAERDGINVDTDSAEVWARRLLEALEEEARPTWGPWTYASAGEAFLALGDHRNVADCFAHYWNMANADGFALAGTERQLIEIWQITDKSADPLLRSLVVHLAARKLAAPRGGARFTPDDLQGLASELQAASGMAEATFGAGSSIPLERMLRLLDRAKSICRITDLADPDRAGTGFLVNGPDLHASLTGVFVLTNHHVLHGPEATDALLACPAYAGSIDVAQAEAEFHYWQGLPKARRIKLEEVLWWSPRHEADFALASLSEAVPPDLAVPLSHTPKPLGSRNVKDPKQRGKVMVVGHPKGGALSFSVSDNEVVDHELDDYSYDHPRRIHYRTPTEPGSSGSPVFHHKTLEAVGLHRSGGVQPLRPDWPRAKVDDVYEANEAVAVRSVLERLRQGPRQPSTHQW
jgi:hypothetical protein